jgi:3-methyladenine DNA glycosylase AlkD
MEKNEIIKYLYAHSDAKVKKHLSQRKGSYEVIGVTMKDIRALGTKLKKNEKLAIELYDTHIFEAMMLATFIMPEHQMTTRLATKWALSAESSQIIDQGLSPLMMKMKDRNEMINAWYLDQDVNLRYAGYSLFSSYFRGESLSTLDQALGERVLSTIKDIILNEPLLIQNAMNNAVVMAGLHVPTLVEKATEVAMHIGHIMPLVARNQCNIQSAYDYLARYKDNPTYSRVAKINKAIDVKK